MHIFILFKYFQVGLLPTCKYLESSNKQSDQDCNLLIRRTARSIRNVIDRMQFFCRQNEYFERSQEDPVIFYPIIATSNRLGVKQTYVYLIKFLVAKSITLWWRVFLEAK